MPGDPEHPEFPYPFPAHPEPPRRTEPLIVPMVAVPEGDATERLRERRTVMLGGPLDRGATNRLCAELMAFDGDSSRDVHLLLNSAGGPLAEVSSILDVIELMHARLNVTCIGSARGTAGIVLACGTGQRRAATHATVSLRCEQPESVHGSAIDIARYAEEVQAIRSRLEQALTGVTGQPIATIAAELDHGGLHNATEARALGLIDEIAAAVSS